MATGAQVAVPKALRAYRSRAQRPDECTIWQAVRATSAAPLYFDIVEFDDGQKFGDGGVVANNPVNHLVAEARLIWGNNYPIEGIVSVGTGVVKLQSLEHYLPTDLAKAIIAANSDCEQVHEDFVRDHTMWDQTSRYFRFNIQRGMEGVELDGWKNQGLMRLLAGKFVGDPQVIPLRKQCARRLAFLQLDVPCK
jgi:hypothetical protein